MIFSEIPYKMSSSSGGLSSRLITSLSLLFALQCAIGQFGKYLILFIPVTYQVIQGHICMFCSNISLFHIFDIDHYANK